MGLQALAQAAHQQGHVGTLASTVGVQLIEHQKFQALAVLDHLPVHLSKRVRINSSIMKLVSRMSGGLSAISCRSRRFPGRCSALR
jgi:hypothetical protein